MKKGFENLPPLILKTITMKLHEKIFHYLILGPIVYAIYFVACIIFDLHCIIQKINKWN